MPRITALPPLSTAVSTDLEIPFHNPSSGDTEKADLGDLIGFPEYGWTAAATWSYSSWSSTTRIGVITVPNGATAIYSPGMRIKITQSTGGTKYGIMVAVAATSLTVFFPSGTTLNNEAISTPFYSSVKVPFGFNADPVIWSLTTTDTSNRATTSTSWTNVGSVSLALGIGCWRLSYGVNLTVERTSTTFASGRVTLSAANNTEDDSSMSGYGYIAGPSGNLVSRMSVFKQKDVNLGAATTYYLNLIAAASSITTTAEGATVANKINAVCGYL